METTTRTATPFEATLDELREYERGWLDHVGNLSESVLRQKLATIWNRAQAAERERCAQICERIGYQSRNPGEMRDTLLTAAARIRTSSGDVAH